jgi:hypothetical protein
MALSISEGVFIKMSNSLPESLSRQEALRIIRQRYSDGALTFDEFRQSFNQVTSSESPNEWKSIISNLPSTSVLQDLDAISPNNRAIDTPSSSSLKTGNVFVIMGEVARTNRPWRFGKRTDVSVIMGAAKLDLSLAELPRKGSMRILVLMGAAHIFIPRSASVRVNGSVFFGAAEVLGEKQAGICFLNGEEESSNENAPYFDIQIVTIFGEVVIQRVDSPSLLPSGH